MIYMNPAKSSPNKRSVFATKYQKVFHLVVSRWTREIQTGLARLRARIQSTVNLINSLLHVWKSFAFPDKAVNWQFRALVLTEIGSPTVCLWLKRCTH